MRQATARKSNKKSKISENSPKGSLKNVNLSNHNRNRQVLKDQRLLIVLVIFKIKCRKARNISYT